MRLLVSFALLAVGFPSAVSAVPARPNLVILLANDLGRFDVDFNGRKDWSTPNLDPLADSLRKDLQAWLATETAESKWGRNPPKPVKPKK